MKQFVLDYLEQECQQAARAITCQRHLKDVDLLIELPGGKRVCLYVINRAIRVPEISEQIEKNTRKHLYSLYILDGRMMPGENDEIEPQPWMATLHALAHGRLYAYWCHGRAVTIRPVHLDWKWGGKTRGVTYGEPVQVNNLHAEMASYTSKYLTGRYAAAEFGEGTFWKKPNTLQDTEFDYSWRRWSYGSSRKSEKTQEEAYDPWEDFEHFYGDMGGGTDYASYKRNAREERKPAKRVQSPLTRHYSLLGVTRESSFDDVKRAYRVKARENHPDLHPNDKEKYTLRMAEINAAFEAIARQLKTSP